jgi:hypothetical protein
MHTTYMRDMPKTHTNCDSYSYTTCPTDTTKKKKPTLFACLFFSCPSFTRFTLALLALLVASIGEDADALESAKGALSGAGGGVGVAEVVVELLDARY